MAKKKAAAPATPAPEATAAPAVQQEPEAHLDPGQLEGMDDDKLRQMAMDIGLDPTAYEGRDALIAAIAAETLTAAPPEPEAPAPEQPPEEPEAGEQPPEEPEAGEQPPEEPEAGEQPPEEAPKPVPVTERPLPCKAEVAASIAVLRRAVIGTAEMVRPVATLDKGTAVTVVAFEGDYARLANGLYVKTTLLV